MLVDHRAGLQQLPGDGRQILPDGQFQRGALRVVVRVDIDRQMRDEQLKVRPADVLHPLAIPLAEEHVKSRAPLAFSPVHVRPVAQQDLERLRPAILHGQMNRRHLPHRVEVVHFRARVQQRLDELHASPLDGALQQRPVVRESVELVYLLESSFFFN